jgi:2-polyprenyl-3-methyl-5-hydroxy-6-metoxy-1,4-benzoquinol methylase
MSGYAPTVSSNEAEATIKNAYTTFEAMAADGEDGQEEDQGGNYYLPGVDTVEDRNFTIFNSRLEEKAHRIGQRVLVGGCGGGLEAEALAQIGYDVTAFDYSPKMIAVAQRRLERLKGNANFYVDDATDLDLSRYKPGFAAVLLLQVVQFLPVIKDDRLLNKAITDLSGLTPEGVFYISTTQYADPRFTRTWKKKGGESGQTTYHSRPAQAIIDLLEKNGMIITHHEHFDAGDTPPDDYKNDYIIAEQP